MKNDAIRQNLVTFATVTNTYPYGKAETNSGNRLSSELRGIIVAPPYGTMAGSLLPVSRGRTSSRVICVFQHLNTKQKNCLWFSNPKMMGITWWNVVDDCGAPGEPNKSGLFDRQMQPKTAYYALNDLLNKEWRTNLVVTIGSDKTLRFRGFKGKYRISYKTIDGKRKEVTINV